MGYKAYPEYKESGIEWLGKVPTGWEVRRLKFMAAIQNGRDYKEVESDEGFPVIGSGGQFTWASNFLYEGESVLFGRKGTINKPLHINSRFWTVDTMFYSIIQPSVFGRYLYYSSTIIHYEKLATQTALPSITQHDLGNYWLCHPSLDEQKNIANFLDHNTKQIDRLIEKKQELIAKLHEQRTAIINQAVTGGVRKNVTLKSSGIEWLGDIPSHWDIWRLRFSVTMSGGMTPSTAAAQYWEGSIPWVTPKDMKSDRITSSIDMLTEIALQETSLQLHTPKQVLIVVRGMILAHTFPVGINDVNVTINQDMKALSTTLNPEYLAILLRGFQSVVLSIVEESAHGTKVLRTDLFKDIPLPVPPEQEQEAIVAYIHNVIAKSDLRIEAVDTAIDRLQEYRTALITAAVTGQIDVRDFRKEQQWR